MNNPKEVVEMKHKFKMPSRIKNYKIEKEFCTIENGHICIANNININEKVLIKIYDKELIQYKTEELSLINNEIFMLRLIYILIMLIISKYLNLNIVYFIPVNQK